MRTHLAVKADDSLSVEAFYGSNLARLSSLTVAMQQLKSVAIYPPLANFSQAANTAMWKPLTGQVKSPWMDYVIHPLDRTVVLSWMLPKTAGATRERAICS